jgi:alginate O-acetyltransferase complex protein AlgI
MVRHDETLSHDDYAALVLTFALILLISATRYLTPELRLTSRPPDVPPVLLTLIAATGVIAIIWRLLRHSSMRFVVSILTIIAIFVIFKYEPLMVWLAEILRAQQGQDVTLASTVDMGWLGFSYVAFRLILTLRDKQTGQLPALSWREYLTYVIFFPAYTAGPIDRAERFVEDYRSLAATPATFTRFASGGQRIVMGLFKKFVIADTLALIALNQTSAAQATSSGGLWFLLYAYAFRLFFDFSGYSDIAIGIGILFGVQLPENFDRPYLKDNITAFWQSWHMTLSSWVRFYVFSPLSRWLLSRPKRPPTLLILLICHLLTMVIIGLWHGITAPFFVWGLWHGAGLFVHKVYSDRTRKWHRDLKTQPRLLRAVSIIGIVLTFHFVLLGWVWFALPDMNSVISFFLRLLGMAA